MRITFFERALTSAELCAESEPDEIYTLQSARTIEPYSPHRYLPFLPNLYSTALLPFLLKATRREISLMPSPRPLRRLRLYGYFSL